MAYEAYSADGGGGYYGYIKIDKAKMSHLVDDIEKSIIGVLEEYSFNLDEISTDDPRVIKKGRRNVNDSKGNPIKDENGNFKTEEYDVFNYKGYVQYYNKAVRILNGKNQILENGVIAKLKKIKTAIGQVRKLVEDFENGAKNIGFVDIEKFKAIDGISVEENEEGTQVVYFEYTDEEGNVIKITLPEAVNSMFTEVGVSSSAVVEATKKFGKNLSTEELTKYIKDTTAFATNANEVHAFGIASKTDIEAFTTNAFQVSFDDFNNHWKEIAEEHGVDLTDYNKIEEELSESINGDTSTLAVSSIVVAAMSHTLPNLFAQNEDDEDEEKDSNKEYSTSNGNKETESIEVLPGDVTGGVETINPDLPSVEPEPELPPEEPITQPEEPTPENPEPVIEPEVTPEVAQGVRDSISEFEGLNSPDKMDEIKLTSDDIDNQARDEYYSDPGLAEKRVSAISEFENMSNEERVSSLEALGYTTVVAAGLVADKATGQAAYIIGIDEQNMANMSNALALQNGITDHNTRFDDGHNLSYFESGQAGVDMTPSTAEVKKARADLTTARGNYNSAVTTANDAINEANESKEKYNNTLSSIKKKKGDNPEDWSKDDVDEYNKVAEEYNAAVKNAEKAVEDAQSKKVVYEAEKAKYDKAYEESVKKAQAGSQEAQDADDSDIINEMVPAEPDITEKVDDNGDFSTDPIPMVPPEELPSEQTPITPPQDVPTQGDSTQGSQLNPGEPVPDENNVYYEE